MKFLLQLICTVSRQPSVPQENASFPQVIHFFLSQAEQLPKLPLFQTYLFLDSEPQLSKYVEVNNRGIKENRSFRKDFHFVTKKKKYKCRQALHEIFLKPKYKFAEVPQSSASTSSFSVVDSSFWWISQPQCQDQQNGEHI